MAKSDTYREAFPLLTSERRKLRREGVILTWA